MKRLLFYIGMSAGLLSSNALVAAHPELDLKHAGAAWYSNEYVCNAAWWPFANVWPTGIWWNRCTEAQQFVKVFYYITPVENAGGSFLEKTWNFLKSLMNGRYHIQVQPKVFGIYRATRNRQPTLSLVKVEKRSTWEASRALLGAVGSVGMVSTLGGIGVERVGLLGRLALGTVGSGALAYALLRYSNIQKIEWNDLNEVLRDKILDYWERVKPDSSAATRPDRDSFSDEYVLVTSNRINRRLYNYQYDPEHYCLVHTSSSSSAHHDRGEDTYYFWANPVGNASGDGSQFLVFSAPGCTLPQKKYKKPNSPDLTVAIKQIPARPECPA